MKKQKETELKTKRLRIRPMTDAALEARMAAEPDAHMRQAYAEMLAGSRAHPADRLWYVAWQIALRDGTPVGDLCYKGAPENGEAEIGYGIDAAFRGQGYATEAVRAMLDWAFSANESLYFILAETEPGNAASARVLEKTGFTPAGTGSEGPRYACERPATSWMAIYMLFGLSIGMSIGTASDNMAVGMSIGMCLGLAVGAWLDKREKTRREAARAAYKTRHPDAP